MKPTSRKYTTLPVAKLARRRLSKGGKLHVIFRKPDGTYEVQPLSHDPAAPRDWEFIPDVHL